MVPKEGFQEKKQIKESQSNDSISSDLTSTLQKKYDKYNNILGAAASDSKDKNYSKIITVE